MWWLAYTLGAEKYRRSAPRVIVSYPDLLADPRRMMERIANTLGLSWSRPLYEVEPDLNAFLDRSMRHRLPDSPVVRAEAESQILAFAEAVYAAILAKPEPSQMDRLHTEFAALVEARSGWRPRLV